MSITRKIKRALRGEVGARAAALEAARRAGAALRLRLDRAALAKGSGAYKGAPGLAPEFERMSGAELLSHFRTRETPRFFAGFNEAEAGSFPPAVDAGELMSEARAILEHRWPLLGFGVLEFGAEVDWLRDPSSGARWATEFHGDVPLVRGDGSDVRVLWELNRLGHLLTLARAYAASKEERFAEEFFAQLEGWRAQNPVGRGPNWACAMEASLRAMNLLASFRLLRRSRALDARRLTAMLALFDEHGRHVRRNLEYSFIATGNHYLSDVAGLLWLGLCLPELRDAARWREFGLRELLREMDKQVLADGADCEASTGYHRFVTEIFLHSFLLCRASGVEFGARRSQRLRSMLEYVRAYLRPDGRAPLLGDADGGRALPLAPREADEHAYLLAVGAVIFEEQDFKVEAEAPAELFWLLGSDSLRAHAELKTTGLRATRSAAFEHAGACVLRDEDLYLLLNASGAGLGGRGAHGHNDALSVEVSANGVSFIADPGTYVYTADARERHLFRSTAHHSTVEVDGAEQSEIDVTTPFIIGDEARPRLVSFASSDDEDSAAAEHHGYARLPRGPVTHRRSVALHKRARFWLMTDTLTGRGEHDFRFRFHAAPGRDVRVIDDSSVEISDRETGARLLVVSHDLRARPELEPRFSSRAYGSKAETTSALWTLRTHAPLAARWLLLPLRAGEDAAARLELIWATLPSDLKPKT